MVSAVVVTAFQCPRQCRVKWRPDIFVSYDDRAAAVFGVARFMEPGFSVAAAVDSVEFKRGVADHGIHFVADDERGGYIGSDFDAEPRVRREIHRYVTDLNRAALPCEGYFIALLVV